MSDLPKLTVIVPCRNEEKFISQCLESIVHSDYPCDRLEVLALDGMSEDETWRIIESYSTKYSFLRGLRNTRRITPAALNIGIENATGEIVCRVDAHASVPSDYLRICVEALLESGADNVGGNMRTLPSNSGLTARGIASAMSHPFGVGNSPFRNSQLAPMWADTVFGGCYRKQLFERIGFFNEGLARGQDMEFNRRLCDAGGKILLDPRIKSSYFASPDLRSFWRHNLLDGEWAIFPFVHSNVIPIRWRHAAPLALVATVIVLASGVLLTPSSLKGLCIQSAVYLILSILSSIQIASREHEWRFVLLMPVVFAVRHIAYGLGSLIAVLSLLRRFLFARHPFRRAYNLPR